MLKADDINAIEDWVQRMERVSQRIEEAASQMQRAAEQVETGANKMRSAIDHIPYSIRLDR